MSTKIVLYPLEFPDKDIFSGSLPKY